MGELLSTISVYRHSLSDVTAGLAQEEECAVEAF
jgi:hypothetical protein